MIEQYPRPDQESESTAPVEAATDYGRMLDEAIQNQQGETMVPELEKVEGSLTTVGPMNVLTPGLSPEEKWTGTISQSDPEIALTPDQEAVYEKYVLASVVATQKGGQRGCMDGRMLGCYMPLGPKTAGGTTSDAKRLYFASLANDLVPDGTYDESLADVVATEERLDFIAGGHELGQCGAEKLAEGAMEILARHPEEISAGVKIFLETLGAHYDGNIQADIVAMAKRVSPQYESVVPGTEEIAHKITRLNDKSCPELAKKHLEHDLVVFTGVDATIDNDLLVKLTTESEAIGAPRQAFAYNWGMHLEIARDADRKYGNNAGQYYLQTVASMDIPTLMQLTDGSLRIRAFQRVD